MRLHGVACAMRDFKRSLRPDTTNPLIIVVPDRLAAYRLSEVTKTVQNHKCIQGKQLDNMLSTKGTPVIKTLTSEKTQLIQHYPILKNWGQKIKPHLDNPELQAILASDFNKYTVGRWGKRFRPGQLPGDFESCDWILGVRGRHPKYFDYVKHGACHWLVNFNHHLAKLVEPNRTWRIITSDEHSTVWDNDSTLFDLNGLALFDSAAECFEAAAFGPNSEVLAPAEGFITGLPEMGYAREIIGLRIKPLYHMRAPTPAPLA